MQEPSLPLHLQAVWRFTPDQVGLAYLAAVVPALICKSHSLSVLPRLDESCSVTVSRFLR
jgi:hypothetical protein